MDSQNTIILWVLLAWMLVIVHWGVCVFNARRYIQTWLASRSYVAGSVKWRLPWNSPFAGELYAKRFVYRAEVTDSNQRHFAVWVRIEHTLLGTVKETEIKFENAHAY